MPDFPTANCGVSSLRLSGEVDIAAVQDVLAQASRCLETRPSTLEVDLGAVTFIDSSGLGALVRIRNEAGRQGTTVVLVNLSPSSRRLLEVSGLDQVFEIGSRE